jgi:hypothetical protein
MSSLTSQFAAMAARIEAGEVTADEYADMLLTAAQVVGWEKSRDELLVEIHARYPTQEQLIAHLQRQLRIYRMVVPQPHSARDLQ